MEPERSRIARLIGGHRVDGAYIRRKALFTRGTDQKWNEGVIAWPCTVGGRRTTDARTPRAASEAAASSEATRGIVVGAGR
jgi:hypothetical protein